MHGESTISLGRLLQGLTTFSVKRSIPNVKSEPPQMLFWTVKQNTGEQQLPLHLVSSRSLRENEVTP